MSSFYKPSPTAAGEDRYAAAQRLGSQHVQKPPHRPPTGRAARGHISSIFLSTDLPAAQATSWQKACEICMNWSAGFVLQGSIYCLDRKLPPVYKAPTFPLAREESTGHRGRRSFPGDRVLSPVASWNNENCQPWGRRQRHPPAWQQVPRCPHRPHLQAKKAASWGNWRELPWVRAICPNTQGPALSSKDATEINKGEKKRKPKLYSMFYKNQLTDRKWKAKQQNRLTL